MITLLWQSALLLLGAYFLGAFAGCLLRRTFFSGGREAVRETRAFAGASQPLADAASPPPPRRLPELEPIRPKIESIPGAPGSALAARSSPEGAGSSDPARFQRALTGQGDYILPQQSGAAPSREPARAQASTKTDPAKPALSGAAAQQTTAARMQPSAAAKAEPVRSQASADAGAFVPSAASAGMRSPPAPSASEVQRADLPVASGTSGQASTWAPSVRAPGAPSPLPVAPPPQPQPHSPVAAQPKPDDLTLIRSIDAALQERLAELGVRRFADIAAWRKDDVRRISSALGFRGRIEQENWIEQAQILAAGGKTDFVRRRYAEQRLARPTPDEGEPGSRSAMTTLSQSTAAASGVAGAVAASSATAPPRRPAVPLGRDNLQRISHINEEVERMLNVQGISRYEQIAHWTGADVSRFERLLGSEGRISRENWIEQAHILARGGDTAFSREFDREAAAKAAGRSRPTQLAEAIRTATPADAGAARRVDFSSFRSVRSEALRGKEAEPASPSGRAAAPAQPDDLKRIRGIGVLIEKKLNAMGFSTYEQIANWTRSDIDRVSEALDFRGRIERENWVEQARILASGGQTEFARRLDRGADR